MLSDLKWVRQTFAVCMTFLSLCGFTVLGCYTVFYKSTREKQQLHSSSEYIPVRKATYQVIPGHGNPQKSGQCLAVIYSNIFALNTGEPQNTS